MNNGLKTLLIAASIVVFGTAGQAQDQVMAIAEYMPSLEGCQTKKDRKERGDCTREKIDAAVAEELKYPKEAMVAGVSGTVVVEIIVDKEGGVTAMNVLEDLGYGTGDAALKALRKFKSWYPAEHFGEKVSAKLTVPVAFVLPEQPVKEEPAPPAPDVYKVVEEMPAWEGCKGDDAKNCTFQAFTKYFMENLKYPEEATEGGVEGTVVTQFVIDEEGKPIQVQVMQGIGGGCDEEAVRLIQEMPVWIPGKQAGKPVKVQMSVPVRFKLKSGQE